MTCWFCLVSVGGPFASGCLTKIIIYFGVLTKSETMFRKYERGSTYQHIDHTPAQTPGVIYSAIAETSCILTVWIRNVLSDFTPKPISPAHTLSTQNFCGLFQTSSLEEMLSCQETQTVIGPCTDGHLCEKQIPMSLFYTWGTWFLCEMFFFILLKQALVITAGDCINCVIGYTLSDCGILSPAVRVLIITPLYTLLVKKMVKSNSGGL